jgi:Xaa-Pro aminopeptidase
LDGGPDAVLELLDITHTIEEQRRSKDPDELELIQFAQWVAGAGFEAARREIRPGMTEMELYSIIQSAMTGRSGRPVELIGDFLSGDRTRRPSGPATSRVVQAGDTVILDLGPVVNGYRSDCTATLVLGGELSPRRRQLEAALHAALAAGEKELRPGTQCVDVYNAVNEVMSEHGFGDHFQHHAGHGLGLDHPEAPYFVPESEEVLLEGDVVTLEPGAYAAEFAGRIEHVYLVTSDGFERLTDHDTAFTV